MTPDNELRDKIGQVISDALTDAVDKYTGVMAFDPFNSYEIDRIADDVLAVLAGPTWQDQIEWHRNEIARLCAEHGVI
jgi:hypothetical protein